MSGSPLELRIAATPDELNRASAWLDDICHQHDVPVDKRSRLELCLHEVLANIMMHGGSTALANPVDIGLELYRVGEAMWASLTVADAGVAFDPLQAELPQRPGSLDQAQPGGLGLVLLRDMASQLSYRHLDGRNQLCISVHWPVLP